MEVKENGVVFSSRSSFLTAPDLPATQVRHIWMMFHGYGQLARFFIRKFQPLPPGSLLVVPQGLSKFYLSDSYERVGASWLTKEDRLTDLANQLTYLDQVYKAISQEIDTAQTTLNVVGFSQGCATAVRWLVHAGLPFDRLILWAGLFPHDVPPGQGHLLRPGARVQLVYGTQDKYVSQEAIRQQIMTVSAALKTPEVVSFDAGHEIPSEAWQQLMEH